MTSPGQPSSPMRRLLPIVIPAVVVGVVSAVLLLAVTAVANRLSDVLWTTIPGAIGVVGPPRRGSSSS